jgi:hypothetical protein
MPIRLPEMFDENRFPNVRVRRADCDNRFMQLVEMSWHAISTQIIGNQIFARMFNVASEQKDGRSEMGTRRATNE